MIPDKQTDEDDRRFEQYTSRRQFLACTGTVLLGGFGGCSETNSPTAQPGSPTGSRASPTDSVFEGIEFTGPHLVATLADDHNVDRLNLIAPDGTTFEQAAVAQGTTRVALQIVSKTGGTYRPGEYDLVADTGTSSESMAVELQPAVRIADVTPEADADGASTGRLLVTVRNAGTGPTWVYNIGYRNAPYRNAPQVIEGSGVGTTTFERPADPDGEFLGPDAEQTFLKRRGVLVVDDTDEVSCEGATAEVTVVVQTPHGDVERPIRARLSGGYHVDDQGAIQHPCEEVQIELADGGGDGV